MLQRSTLLFWVFVSVIAAQLISACVARLAEPAARPGDTDAMSQDATQAQATEAPAEATRLIEGTPPGFPTEVVQAVVTDAQVIALLAGLEQRGFELARGDASRVELLSGAPGQAYRLGDGWLHVHVYADALAAEAAAANIQTAMPHPLLDWVAPPHFFQCDRLIALYLGADQAVIAALTELCAPPFYTTDLRPAEPSAAAEPLTTVDAALAWLLKTGAPVHATSAPDVRRMLELDSGVALLYTYGAEQAGQPVLVTRFSYLHWRDPVWYPDGDFMDVVSHTKALPPLQFLTGTYVVNGGIDTPELPDRVTFAGGRVSDPAVVSVRVHYSDGATEVVPVENGAYLAARLDVERVLSVEALDQIGQVLSVLNAEPAGAP